MTILQHLNSHLVGRVKELYPKFEAFSASEIFFGGWGRKMPRPKLTFPHPWLTAQSQLFEGNISGNAVSGLVRGWICIRDARSRPRKRGGNNSNG